MSAASFRVCYQGAVGCNSESALLECFVAGAVASFGRDTFSDCFAAVRNGAADAAFVPIENSIGGALHDNHDLLLANDRLRIRGEYEYRVRHALLAHPDVTDTRAIRRIISHPQALAQCTHFTANFNGGTRTEPFFDTAGAAKFVSDGAVTDTAALAPRRCADVYKLKVVASDCQNDDDNFTRFIIVTADVVTADAVPLRRGAVSDAATYKCAIAFGLSNEAGALFKALAVFALRNLTLTHVQSRPTPRTHHAAAATATRIGNGDTTSSRFQYAFFLDFVYDAADAAADRAVAQIQEFATFCRELGRFPTSDYLSKQIASANASLSAPKAKLSAPLAADADTRSIRIGVYGFGPFGQFLARQFARRGHDIVAHSRSDYTREAAALEGNVHFVADVNEFAKTRVDVIIFAQSIISFQQTVAAFPFQLVNASTLIADCLSVKAFAKSVLCRFVPAEFDIVCSHPMFGPQSGRHGWNHLTFVYEKVRVRDDARCERFLRLFKDEECRMLEMNSDVHDQFAANSQFITHTTGRLLDAVGCTSTPINTAGFNDLLRVINQTTADSFDLYRGLYIHNEQSKITLNALSDELATLRRRLDDTTISRRVTRMAESATVAMTDLAKSMSAKGIPVISLSVGEPVDVQTPKAIVDATIDAVTRGHTKYTAVNGTIELRKAIANKLRIENAVDYSAEEILVSNGAKQSVFQAICALSNEGDQVIIPAPYWVSYPDMCILCGSTPVILATDEADGFAIRPDALRQCLRAHPQAKLLILCSPSNPTGAVMSAASISDIAAVLADFPAVYVLSDEIYEKLCFEPYRHVSIASMPNMRERTITVNGFSKSFAMTGYRLGYAAAPAHLIKEMSKIQGQITSCASAIAQFAALKAFDVDCADEMKRFHDDLIEKLTAKRDWCVNKLTSVAHVRLAVPNGAFYLLPNIAHYFGYSTPDGTRIRNATDFCLFLLHTHHVALVPGEPFGAPNCVRISYANKPELVETAVQRIVDAVTSLKRAE